MACLLRATTLVGAYLGGDESLPAGLHYTAAAVLYSRIWPYALHKAGAKPVSDIVHRLHH